MAKTLIVITGPTAVGKTALAINLAQYYHTEIISADSRQFYREMEIGTAKPSPAELSSAPHHFINSHSVTDSFSVGDYEKQAIALVEKLFLLKDVLILVGGSGLFIDAIISGFDELPSASKETREELNNLLSEHGLASLRERLKIADPVYFDQVDIHNPQRIIRALEVYETTGIPFSQFRKRNSKTRMFNIIKIGLNTDRKTLYEQINKRVDAMMSQGLLDEVKSLEKFRNLNPLNTVGYSELFDYLDGKNSLEDAVNKIKQNTRRFAKRQLTWFNKTGDIKWFEPLDFDQVINYLRPLTPDPAPGEQKN